VKGSCKVSTVKNGKKIKVTCLGALAPITYSLGEPTQGSMEVHVVSGTTRWCARFDTPGTDQPGRFLQKNAPTALECSTSPGPY